ALAGGRHRPLLGNAEASSIPRRSAPGRLHASALQDGIVRHDPLRGFVLLPTGCRRRGSNRGGPPSTARSRDPPFSCDAPPGALRPHLPTRRVPADPRGRGTTIRSISAAQLGRVPRPRGKAGSLTATTARDSARRRRALALVNRTRLSRLAETTLLGFHHRKRLDHPAILPPRHGPSLKRPPRGTSPPCLFCGPA